MARRNISIVGCLAKLTCVFHPQALNQSQKVVVNIRITFRKCNSIKSRILVTIFETNSHVLCLVCSITVHENAL